MCTVIDADCVLANLLQRRWTVTAVELNTFRSFVESACSDVYLDVTSSGLLWAVNTRPDMFRWSGNGVQRVSEWSEDHVERYFNWRVPSHARDIFRSALSAAAP